MSGKRNGKIDEVDIMADPTPDTVTSPASVRMSDAGSGATGRRSRMKVQSLISISILLFGLFAGSLFVDIAQLLTQEGYSRRAVREANMLESSGKTWVAYTDPKVSVSVVTDDSCDKCSPDEALVWFRRILPTMEATPYDISSEEGKSLVSEYGIVTLPAFVFSGEVAGTDFYLAASEIFSRHDDGFYLIDTVRLGIPPGRYVRTPEVGDDALVFGSRDAKIRVVEYLDFQDPYCKVFDPVMSRLVSEYGDRVAFVFKQLPFPFHAQAENASLASECANEQGKFMEYSGMLYERQAEWSVTQDDTPFGRYARILGLDVVAFDGCLGTRKYAEKVGKDMLEADAFGIDATPAVFVGDDFFPGAASYEELRAAIESRLAE